MRGWHRAGLASVRSVGKPSLVEDGLEKRAGIG
jgi:hypothetical protein